ncbi:hypothetical protein ACEWY4_005861 [Coilia grayii]|uniref:Gypsy retrotransposon integrase-like protein 1 n=1 Tax=Coilia grayii TaxID=363190 RepID=A0ABD1KK54_9TELE
MAGHQGVFKTYKRLQEVAFWPRMWSDVKEFVRNCTTCQTIKNNTQKPAGLGQQTSDHRPNQMIKVDLMGHLPWSVARNEHLLIFVDYFTRWVELFPVRLATAQVIANIFHTEIITRWEVPDYILSDRGSQFVSSVFRELCGKWAVQPRNTTAYHPQTNMTERVNRNLKTMITSYVADNHRHWDKYLPEFRFALNSAVHETTGLSPAELQLGRKLKCPLDKVLLWNDLTPDSPPYDMVQMIETLKAKTRESSKPAKQRQLRNYNKHHRDVVFNCQDRVWVRNHPQSKASKHFAAKLAPKWKGPYRVVKPLGPVNYLVVQEDNGEDLSNVNVVILKPCYPIAEGLDAQERQKLLDLFEEESSDDEDFPGFQ